MERIRFTNSGTEANLHALAAARLFTGKNKIVAFGGGYHGAVFGFKDGAPAPNNVDKDDWVVARYNDLESATQAIQTEGVAAVILEAMQGSGGCICGTPEFLTGIQEAANKARFLSHTIHAIRLTIPGRSSSHRRRSNDVQNIRQGLVPRS